MKAKSGNPGSLPGKPKTTSNTTAPTPSAAAKLSTTVAMSSSGATSARSRNARITNTITSAIGTSSFVSDSVATRRSRSTADGPPTSAPGAASWTASRSRGMTS